MQTSYCPLKVRLHLQIVSSMLAHESYRLYRNGEKRTKLVSGVHNKCWLSYRALAMTSQKYWLAQDKLEVSEPQNRRVGQP